MARVETRVNYNTFVGGKVSDSNPINPPENVVRTLSNVDLSTNGKIGRRLGLEPETNFNFPTEISTGSAGTYYDGYTQEELQSISIDTFTWRNVDNQSVLTYKVLRIGTIIHFYTEGASLSNNHIWTVDISPYTTGTVSESKLDGIQFAAGKGLLLCTGSKYKPFYIQHTTSTDTWTSAEIEIETRDFEGAPETVEVDDRPTVLTDNHAYNLKNQGWSLSRANTFKTSTTVYPSNADVQLIGNTTDGSGNPTFNPSLITTGYEGGNTPAPKGHYVLDPFNTTIRSSLIGRAVTGGEVITERPKAVAFFAGRFFYGSVNGRVYYTQIINSTVELGACYQEQDPTAEDFNELLDTDGGTLDLLDIGEVERMVVMGPALVLFGTQGIYSLSGGDVGFTANNQYVSKVSTVAAVGYRSIVSAEGAVFLWAQEGIYVAQVAQGGVQLQTLSENRIARDYNIIPAAARAFAQGHYDNVERRVYWSYSQYTSDPVSDIVNKYTNILVYSVPLNAFWDYQLTNVGFTAASVNYPILAGLFSPSFQSYEAIEETVTDGGVVVTDSAVAVTVDVYQSSFKSVNIKAVIFLPDSVGDFRPTFGQFSSRTFTDWAGLDINSLTANTNYSGLFPVEPMDGGNFTSVVETLPVTLGEPSLQKQAPYIYTYYDYRREGYGEADISEEFGT